MTEGVLNNVLGDSFELICGLVAIQTVAKNGNEAKALEFLARLKPEAEDLLPRLKGVMHAVSMAQAQAEQVRDLPKPRIVCLAAFGQPQPHPHTANTHTPPPQSPGPKVA